MASNAETSNGAALPEAGGKPMKLPTDRFRVMKQQIQSVNTAQTKVHTMFEQIIADLEKTKTELEATKAALAEKDEELKATKSELDQAKTLADCALRGQSVMRNSIDRARATNSARTNWLQQELQKAREKAKKNADAQQKLDQLRTAMSGILYTGSPSGRFPNVTGAAIRPLYKMADLLEGPRYKEPTTPPLTPCGSTRDLTQSKKEGHEELFRRFGWKSLGSTTYE